MAKQRKLTVDDIIQKAVTATRIATERQGKDAYKMTEKRLYAYPVIKLKIENDHERIEDIQQHGAPGKSNSVVRFQRSGLRLDPEEIVEALIKDIEAQIAEGQHEISTIETALKIIADEPYSEIVKHKYFEQKSDDDIAEIMNCDPSTIRRNKSRLVVRMAVFLYGVAALS